MFNWKEETIAQNAIYLDDEVAGKGRQFKSRFLVPGLVKYDYGVCLLTKENADKFIQNFVGCPVIINHQDVTNKNAKEISVGNIFSVWFDEKDGYYWCNGIITDKHAIELIDKGYSVSCQYTITEYSDNVTGALHNGNPYDKVIEDGKPEHLAIVNNPRYEGAIIAVNAILAQNEDQWITIKPNGEENKGRHLLIKDGESVEDVMHRNGWYKKRQAKEDNKEESFEKETPRSKKDENRHQKVKDLEDKAYKEFKTIYENYIHDDDMEGWGHITGSQFSKKVKEYNEKYQKAFKDLESDRFVSFDEFARREQKQDKKEQTLDDKIKEHESEIPKNYKRDTKTKALWLYKNSYITRTEFDSVQKASNAFISEFKDTLYTTIAEGISKRLGELIASNEDKWITIYPHGDESDDYRRLKIKEGETVEDAMHRQGYYSKRQAKDEKLKKEQKNFKTHVENIQNEIRKFDDKYDEIESKLSVHRRNIYQMYEDFIREEADKNKEKYIEEHKEELEKLTLEQNQISEDRLKKHKELDAFLEKEVETVLNVEIGNLDKDSLDKLIQKSKELFNMPIIYPLQLKLQQKIADITEKINGLKYQSTRKEVTQISGVTKGKAMTFKEADSGKVNPNFGKNTSQLSYSQNCQSCVVCYQMRRNGFNVQTKGIPVNSKGEVIKSGKMYELAQHPEKAWINPKTGLPPELNICDVTTPKKAYEWLNDNIKDGTYSFRVVWRGSRSGHIVIAHKENDNLSVYDPQTNKKYNDETSITAEFFNKCKLRSKWKEHKPFIYRTDNLDINPDYADVIMEKP